MEKSNENVIAIQFNGWNFGAIEDWFYGYKGLYEADFKEVFNLGKLIIHRNDWVIKKDDGSFTVMSNYEYRNLV